MKELGNAGITSPLGFKANGIACGLKKSGKPDLALIYSLVPATAAAVFTKNAVKAAHIMVDAKHLRFGEAQAIIVNSGNANCCTGARGIKDAQLVVTELAASLEVLPSRCLMASTGVIGKYLKTEKILAAIPQLIKGLGFDGSDAANQAIMTTDKFPKQATVRFLMGKKTVTIAAMAKGAGMICPDMATMLCFVTTDANISLPGLRKALKLAVDASFNCISVDGEMSTNDSVFVLANGLAENKRIGTSGPGFEQFCAGLTQVCLKLAKMVVEDGEGATKVIEMRVEGAATQAQAKQAALRLANSPLIKTMIAGENPNWGRIPAAIGAAGVKMNPDKLSVELQGKTVYQNSVSKVTDLDILVPLLRSKDIVIRVKLFSGKYSQTMWASDLTHEYITINTEYN